MSKLFPVGAIATSNNCMVGTRLIEGAGWRVVLVIGEEAQHMAASEARTMAAAFETPYARLNGFSGVGDKLRELADWVDEKRGIRDRE